MEIKLKCLRFTGADRNIGGVVLRAGDEIALDDGAVALAGGAEGLRAPQSELDRFVGDWPAEFRREYEKPPAEAKPAFVPASAKEKEADGTAVPEPSAPPAKRGV